MKPGETCLPVAPCAEIRSSELVKDSLSIGLVCLLLRRHATPLPTTQLISRVRAFLNLFDYSTQHHRHLGNRCTAMFLEILRLALNDTERLVVAAFICDLWIPRRVGAWSEGIPRLSGLCTCELDVNPQASSMLMVFFSSYQSRRQQATKALISWTWNKKDCHTPGPQSEQIKYHDSFFASSLQSSCFRLIAEEGGRGVRWTKSFFPLSNGLLFFWDRSGPDRMANPRKATSTAKDFWRRSIESRTVAAEGRICSWRNHQAVLQRSLELCFLSMTPFNSPNSFRAAVFCRVVVVHWCGSTIYLQYDSMSIAPPQQSVLT